MYTYPGLYFDHPEHTSQRPKDISQFSQLGDKARGGRGGWGLGSSKRGQETKETWEGSGKTLSERLWDMG